MLECENVRLNECLGLKKDISVRFLSPYIGLRFKSFRGTPLSKIRGCTSPAPGLNIFVNPVGKLSASCRQASDLIACERRRISGCRFEPEIRLRSQASDLSDVNEVVA